jgi:hypothetical protein
MLLQYVNVTNANILHPKIRLPFLKSSAQSPHSDTSAPFQFVCSSLLGCCESQAVHLDGKSHHRTDPAVLEHQYSCRDPPHGSTARVRFRASPPKHQYEPVQQSRRSLHSKLHGGYCSGHCFAVGRLLHPSHRLPKLLSRCLHRCGFPRMGHACMHCHLECYSFQTCLYPLPHLPHLDCRCPMLWRVSVVLMFLIWVETVVLNLCFPLLLGHLLLLTTSPEEETQ